MPVSPDITMVPVRWIAGYGISGAPAVGYLFVSASKSRLLDASVADESVAVLFAETQFEILPTIMTIDDEEVEVGVAEFELPATDDMDLTGAPFTYLVREELTLGAGGIYGNIDVPAATVGTLDLSAASATLVGAAPSRRSVTGTDVATERTRAGARADRKRAEDAADAADASADAAAVDAAAAATSAASIPFNADSYASLDLAVAAVTAAGGGTVLCTAGVTYNITTLISVGSKVTVEGRGARVEWTGSSATTMLAFTASTSGGTVRDLILDGNGIISGQIVNIALAATDALLERCTLIAPGSSAGIGVRVRDGVARATVRQCTIDTVFQGVFVDGTVTDLTLDRNTINNWVQRGIYVLGTSSTGCDRLSILGNRLGLPAAGGSVRQPITIQGVDARLHTKVKVNDNVVDGPNTAYANVTTPGTADQISLHRCLDFEVRGNRSTNGGDGGITIAQQCRRGVVSGNICVGNDNAGIYLGSGSSSYVRAITVTGNTCMNNAQDRDAAGDGHGAGVRAWKADSCVIAGNALGDDQTTKTQKHGVRFQAATNVTAGPNTDAGVSVSLYYDFGDNTGCTVVEGTAL